MRQNRYLNDDYISKCTDMMMVQFMSDNSGLKTRSLRLKTLGTASLLYVLVGSLS